MIIRNTVKAIALGVLVMPVMTACATKGFVRESIATERTSIDAAVAQNIATERSAREAADAQLNGSVDQLRTAQTQMRTDIDGLRRDITTLRNDFNVEVTQLKEGMKFSMPVSFNFNDANVREDDKAVLDRFASVVNSYYAGSRITVEGFADPAGSPSYNQRLSKTRADNVKSYLISKGLPTDVVATVGYGETRQVVAGASKDQPGAELNRRVVFVIESKPGAITMSSEELGSIPPR
jgi:outer membrane protein OmpA-like peptidoglycan-associated protein